MTWLSGSWDYRKEIRYSSYVPSSDLTDYPDLIIIKPDYTAGQYVFASPYFPHLAVTLADGTTTIPFGMITHVQEAGILGSGTYSGATITITGHGLANNNRVCLTGANLGSILSDGTYYYVVNVTTNTFQLSSTQGGSGLSAGTSGSFASGRFHGSAFSVYIRAKLSLDHTKSSGNVKGYIYYSTTETDQENESGVMDSNTVAYWPLEESPDNTSGQIKDWSSNANHATSVNTPTSGTGQVANDIAFAAASNQFITLPFNVITYGTSVSWSCWVRTNAAASDNLGIVNQANNTNDPSTGTQPSGTVPILRISTDGKLHGCAYWFNNGSLELYSTTAVDDTAWHHVALTYDSATGVQTLYIDGTAEATNTPGAATSYSATAAYYYLMGSVWASSWPTGVSGGIVGSGWKNFEGVIDEARLASVARSAAWTAYEYANEANNSDTVLFGTQEAPATSPSLPIGQGSYTITGNAVSLLHKYPIAIGQGSLILTGKPVVTKWGHVVTITKGNYTLTGGTVAFVHGHPFTIGQGSYTITGKAVSFVHGRPIVIGQGTYTLSGKTVNLLNNHRVVIAQGGYTITGKAVALTAASHSILVSQGSYTLTGEPVSLLHKYPMSAAQGSYAITGKVVNLLDNHGVQIVQGSYAITGKAVSFPHTYVVTVNQGSYVITGEPVALNSQNNKSLAITQGDYVLSGQVVQLLTKRYLGVLKGNYTVAGQPVNLEENHVVLVNQGSYGITGKAVSLLENRRVTVTKGNYTLTGQSVNFPYIHNMAINCGLYNIQGKNVNLVNLSVYLDVTGPLHVSDDAFQVWSADAIQYVRD